MQDEKSLKEGLIADLEQRRQQIEGMGGPARIASQRKKNKLTARERINLLMDPGTFHELWMFGASRVFAHGVSGGCCSDGIRPGERPHVMYIQDFTTQGGTLAETHPQFASAWMRYESVPGIGINDSGGARIRMCGCPAGSAMFYRNTLPPGIPQICAIWGPAPEGCLLPGFDDFVFIGQGLSYAYITDQGSEGRSGPGGQDENWAEPLLPEKSRVCCGQKTVRGVHDQYKGIALLSTAKQLKKACPGRLG